MRLVFTGSQDHFVFRHFGTHHCSGNRVQPWRLIPIICISWRFSALAFPISGCLIRQAPEDETQHFRLLRVQSVALDYQALDREEEPQKLGIPCA
jgi:hypothetical protein